MKIGTFFTAIAVATGAAYATPMFAQGSPSNSQSQAMQLRQTTMQQHFVGMQQAQSAQNVHQRMQFMQQHMQAMMGTMQTMMGGMGPHGGMMQGASAAGTDPAAMQMRLDHMQARMREMTQIDGPNAAAATDDVGHTTRKTWRWPLTQVSPPASRCRDRALNRLIGGTGCQPSGVKAAVSTPVCALVAGTLRFNRRHERDIGT